MNYKDNTYHYRQDSNFLYFFGINKPGFYGICDSDDAKDTLYGDDFTMADIIWMGDQPSVKELAAKVACRWFSVPMADPGRRILRKHSIRKKDSHPAHLPG